jgi:hypothetical protein
MTSPSFYFNPLFAGIGTSFNLGGGFSLGGWFRKIFAWLFVITTFQMRILIRIPAF